MESKKEFKYTVRLMLLIMVDKVNLPLKKLKLENPFLKASKL